ncbi:MAG: insulinase family protein [Clostridia bacterium]|nr:insulinase family protein [Clostridia bacterium]
MLERKIKIQAQKEESLTKKELLEELKGYISSQTYKNYTNYYYKTNAKKFYKLMPIFLELMQKKIQFYDNHEAERYLYRKVLLEEKSVFESLYNKTLKLMYRDKNIYLDNYGFKNDNTTITEQELLNYYHDFYSPKNSIVVAYGNFDINTLTSMVRNSIYLKESNFNESSNEKQVKEYTEEKYSDYIELEDFSEKYFCFGIKLNPESQEIAKRKILMDIIIERYFGTRSQFQENIRGLVKQEDFKIIVENNKMFSHIMFVGKSNMRDEILNEIRKTLKRMSLDKEGLELAKRRVLFKLENDSFTNINKNIVQSYFGDSREARNWLKKDDIDLMECYRLIESLKKAKIFVVKNQTIIEGRN